MDASQYLKHKIAAQKNYIARQGCVDAGLHTYIKQKAAESYYVSPNSNATILHSDCCPTTLRYGGSDYVTPVKPVSGCASAGACAQLTDPYTTPYIVLPCCSIPYTSTSYVAACTSNCYVGTRVQTAASVKQNVDKERYDCC
jgi:hypothetical protein